MGYRNEQNRNSRHSEFLCPCEDQGGVVAADCEGLKRERRRLQNQVDEVRHPECADLIYEHNLLCSNRASALHSLKFPRLREHAEKMSQHRTKNCVAQKAIRMPGSSACWQLLHEKTVSSPFAGKTGCAVHRVAHKFHGGCMWPLLPGTMPDFFFGGITLNERADVVESHRLPYSRWYKFLPLLEAWRFEAWAERRLSAHSRTISVCSFNRARAEYIL